MPAEFTPRAPSCLFVQLRKHAGIPFPRDQSKPQPQLQIVVDPNQTFETSSTCDSRLAEATVSASSVATSWAGSRWAALRVPYGSGRRVGTEQVLLDFPGGIPWHRAENEIAGDLVVGDQWSAMLTE